MGSTAKRVPPVCYIWRFWREAQLRSAVVEAMRYPACRLRRPYGANIKRHGFAVLKLHKLIILR